MCFGLYVHICNVLFLCSDMVGVYCWCWLLVMSGKMPIVALGKQVFVADHCGKRVLLVKLFENCCSDSGCVLRFSLKV